MSHSYTNLLFYVVFATKGRAKDLSAGVQSELYPYLIALAREKECEVDAVAGGLEHVHLLIRAPAKNSVADLVKFLKGNSSRWLGRKLNPHFAWQAGYAAFSVSQSKRGEVGDYIRGQEEHHRRYRFEDEYVGLLKKNEIEFEERLWESGRPESK